MKRLFSTVMCLAAFVAYAEKPSMDRYQAIIDRQMFGPLPPGFDPTKSPDEVQNTSGAAGKELTKEQEKLQSSVHFSVINVDPSGATVVGFTDNSDPKAPKHYYLKVGESRDGWEVKSADSETATMTVVKNDIEVTLKLGGNSATDAGATAKAGGGASAAANPAGMSRSGLLGVGTLRARRMLRQQQQQAAQAKAAEETAAREAEREAQAEQEKAQRDAERAEQRQQLMAIQEELKRVREAKTAEKKNEDAGAQNSDQ